MNEQEFRELSAARALHALSPDEEQAFSIALAAHPEWQPVVDEDRETVAALSRTAPEVTPPAAARAAILDLVSRSPQFDAAAPGGSNADADEPDVSPYKPADRVVADDEDDDEDVPIRQRRRAAWFALAASILVLLVISLSVPWGHVFPPRDPVALALQQIEATPDADAVTARLSNGATGTLHWSDQAQQAVLVTQGMTAAPSGHDYELWIVRGDQPTSLGVMRVGADGGAAVIAQGFVPGDALAVTVDERGGSPTGAPTTDPLFVLASV